MHIFKSFLLRLFLNKTKPNLFLVGPPKSASTFLHVILASNPKVFSTTNKELRFFSNPKKLRNPLAWRYYKNCYPQTSQERKKYKYFLDSTPSYFEVFNINSPYQHGNSRNKNVPLAIRRSVGDEIKIIIVIRNPVMRAISHYFHHAKVGRLQKYEGRGIFEISALYPETLTAGNYANHIKNWELNFPNNQILYVNYSDIKNKPDTVIQKVFSFLNLELDHTTVSYKPVNEGFDLTSTKKGLQININSSQKANTLMTDLGLANLQRHILSDNQRENLDINHLKDLHDIVIRDEELKSLISYFSIDTQFLTKKFPEMIEEINIHHEI